MKAKISWALVGLLAALTITHAAPASAQSSITANVLKSGVLRIAIAGGNAPFSSIDPNGEAIGYDVDVAKAFAAALKVKPEFITVDSPGRITALNFPGGPGIRVDSAMHQDAVIPTTYDSMVAKLIAFGSNRDEAIARMRRALDTLVIEGIKTTAPPKAVFRLARSRAFAS